MTAAAARMCMAPSKGGAICGRVATRPDGRCGLHTTGEKERRSVSATKQWATRRPGPLERCQRCGVAHRGGEDHVFTGPDPVVVVEHLQAENERLKAQLVAAEIAVADIVNYDGRAASFCRALASRARRILAGEESIDAPPDQGGDA